MIAEIYSKVSSTNSNLSERLEDELTGNFFGNMRYISFNKGMKHILKNCVKSVENNYIFNNLNIEEWNNCIEFWPREKECEIDIRISLENILIGIEVKLWSGLSSDDDKVNIEQEIAIDEFIEEKSKNQLARESQMLARIGGKKEKILILLGDEMSCYPIYSKVMERNILEANVKLLYMNWQDILLELKKLNDLNSYEQLIVDDIVRLLEEKGFERFKNFDMDLRVEEKNWNFVILNDYFNFKEEFKKIEEEKYYGFGEEYI